MTPAPLKLLALAAATGLAVAAAPAGAVLMSANDFVFGAGAITRDTVTGFEWLDLDRSDGLPYSTVEFQTGAGGPFEGWRHATLAETATLLANAGFPVGHLSSPPAVGFRDLVMMLGPTTEQLIAPVGEILVVRGQNFNEITGVSRYTELTYDSDPAAVVAGDDRSQVRQFDIVIVENTDAGHWLVRETATAVPEPGSLAVFALGLAGLVLARADGKTKARNSSRA